MDFQIKKEDVEELEAIAPRVFNIIQVSSVVYAVLGMVGVAVCFFVHHNLPALISLQDRTQLFYFLKISILGTGVLLTLSYLFEGWFESYRLIKNIMVDFLGKTSILSGVYLAFISAVGEEIFFRGALLPAVGLVISSCIFGLLHVGPAGKTSAWTLWATLAGLLLGWVCQETQSLIAPMTIHFVINCFSILVLQRKFRLRQTHAS